MTEAEWLACEDSHQMLECLRGKATDRKLVLFASACRRRVWHWMKEAACRDAVAAAERSADGHASSGDVKAAMDAACDVTGLPYEEDPDTCPPVGSWYAARAALDAEGPSYTARYTAWAAGAAAATGATRWDDPAWGQVLFAAWARHHRDSADRFWDNFFWDAPYELGWDGFLTFPGWVAERKEQASLLRCLFGPLPFRPVRIEPDWLAWNAGTVPRLAQAIYEERAYDRLPLLADALQDAGCSDPDLLGHLRGPGPHARGCWAVDLLLGKE